MNKSVPLEVIIEEYTSGQTLQEIADHYGVTRQAVQQRLARKKISRRPRNIIIKQCLCGAHFYGQNKYCSKECVALFRRKQAYCKRGHPLTIDNLYPRYSSTPPRCKICARIRTRDWQRKKRERIEKSN